MDGSFDLPTWFQVMKNTSNGGIQLDKKTSKFIGRSKAPNIFQEDQDYEEYELNTLTSFQRNIATN